jgi:drug/metabolite transporter (DMT)-like permease
MATLSSRWHGDLLALLAVAMFAGTYPATSLAVAGGVSPLSNAVWRTALAGSLAALVLLCAGRAGRLPLPEERWRVLAVGLGTLLFPVGVGWGVSVMPAGRMALAMALLPPVTALYAGLRGQAWPALRFWLGSAVAMGLVAGFILLRPTHGGGASHPWQALAAVLVALAAAAVAYVEGGLLARQRPAWRVISWGVAGLLPLTVPVSVWLLLQPQAVPPSAWWGVAYGGVFSAWIGFFAWFAALARSGVPRAGQVQYLQPFLAAGYGMVLLHEPCGPADVLLALLVVGAIAWGRAKPLAAAPLLTRPQPVALVAGR